MKYSVDPDQLADQDLHCLLRSKEFKKKKNMGTVCSIINFNMVFIVAGENNV